MSNKTIGAFISDTHFPDSINITPVLEYLRDLRQTTKEQKAKFNLILGGDIIDAKDMHGVDGMQPSQLERDAIKWYERDVKLMTDFILKVKEYVGTDIDLTFLEGNHEDRYGRIMRRYPATWGGRFDFMRDVIKKVYPKAKWVPYGEYTFYQLGDCYFIHGTWPLPDHHSKKIIITHTPYKVVYAHLHTFQAYTLHNAVPSFPPRYAVTSGCLTSVAPEWKKGCPNMWVNGFVDFICDNGITTPTPHIIEKNKFQVGGKEYK